jgi:hypothetical protein
LLAFAIAAVIALVVFTLGQVNQATFESSCHRLASKMATTSAC